jgi:medium-chain acyl-[acyl-carrier-protein] hydrolase
MFHPWREKLQPGIELCAVQLPGRGNRLHEKPHSRLGPLLDELVDSMKAYLDPPVALFGHSMGAIVAFELARRLRDRLGKEPRHLFISGRRAPHLRRAVSTADELSDAELIGEVRRLNGTPSAVLEDPELLQLVLPALRADFALCDTYQYAPGPPLRCSMSVFGGLDDVETPPEDLAEWREHTTGAFGVRMMPGDHFFVTKSPDSLLRAIAADVDARPFTTGSSR